MSTCCLPFTFHEGTPTGKYESIFGLDSYQVGDKNSSKVIVLICDIYGPKFKNLQLIADVYAKEGYFAVCPDILGGEVLQPDWSLDVLMPWISARSSEVTRPIVEKYLTTLRAELKPKFLASVGYCFGAKYTLQQLGKDGLIDAGAIAHPSFAEVAEFELVAKPLIVAAAETDQLYPAELRHQAEEAVLKTGTPFQSTLFQGTSHGFAVKGDYSIEAVRYAGQKALKDQIEWFNRFSK